MLGFLRESITVHLPKENTYQVWPEKCTKGSIQVIKYLCENANQPNVKAVCLSKQNLLEKKLSHYWLDIYILNMCKVLLNLSWGYADDVL